MINKGKIKDIFSSFNLVISERKVNRKVIKDLDKQLFSKNKKLKIKTMLFFSTLIALFLLAIFLIIFGVIIHFVTNFSYKDDIYHSFLIFGVIIHFVTNFSYKDDIYHSFLIFGVMILSFLAIYLVIWKKLKNNISKEKRDGLFNENNAIKWRWMINFYKIKPAKPKKIKKIKEVESL
ncbi:MAG: hypothetical protein ACRDCG_01135 [Mycoplasmoidaceae bacterium]